MVGAGRWAFEGITVPVLDMELAELESSSSSINGSGGGSEESFVFAKDLARSDIMSDQFDRYHASTSGSPMPPGFEHKAARCLGSGSAIRSDI